MALPLGPWLKRLCQLLPDARGGVVWLAGGDAPAKPVASWPADAPPDPALALAAGLAVDSGRPVLRSAAEGPGPSHRLVACPVALSEHGEARAAVAVAIDSSSTALSDEILLERVRISAAWLPMLSAEPVAAAVEDEPAGGRLYSRLASNPRLQPALQKFTVRLEEKLAAMASASEAGDYEELARLAHWLKGSGGTVGFDAFTAPAERLERHSKERKADEIGAVLRELQELSARISLDVPPDAGPGEPGSAP